VHGFFPNCTRDNSRPYNLHILKCNLKLHTKFYFFQVKYEQTISYIRCQNVDQTKQSFVSWDPVELWESLTNNIDVVTLPSSHFELLDQSYAEICGLVIMTTAVMKHRNLTEWQPSPRSNQEKRLINFLKSAVEVLISYDDGTINITLQENTKRCIFLSCFWLD
jgi:hypothetical protein